MQKPGPETQTMTVAIAADYRVAAPATGFGRLLDALRWLIALQRRHRERRQLAAMDDAALKDIGLSRCDVIAELRKPRWRR
jgi:uncharacterized protein YjiS (DUF1127 family)